MRVGQVLLGASVIAATPIGVLVVLLTNDAASVPAGLAGIVVIAVVSAAVATVWARDLATLHEQIRYAGAMNEPAGPQTGRLHLRSTAVLKQDIDRLVRVLAARASQAERLQQAEEAIVERLPDPLIVVRSDQSVQRANAAARATFGDEMPAVLRHPGLRTAIDRALAQGVTQTADLSLPAPVAREVNATVLAMAEPGVEQARRIIAVLSDRTREHAVERMRADFVANASHELRTPLASLIGFIDTLRGPAADDPPAQARFLKIMSEQAARMNRLIDDLLSLSRVELVEHQQPAAQIDLADLVRVAAAGFEPHVQSRGNTLAATVAADLPAIVGDGDQLAQVLQNLLENALKYGREGGVIRLTAAVAASSRWPPAPGVTIVVSDDGQGIAREHLPRLTERFYRIDQGRSRAVGGTGLGLAIVKHIVNRHRGQLLIESTLGVGSTFTIWLPVSSQPRGSASA